MALFTEKEMRPSKKRTQSIKSNVMEVQIRDGSRLSNILFNYRILIRLCDYFLKVYQGLTKTVRWHEGRSDLSHQIGPLQVVTKLYHLHAFLSLVCLKM